MKQIARIFILWLGFCGGALAKDKAGEFDYYVFALSWSPNWCRLEGEARESEQCEERRGWVVHGLWPQYETGGYPQDCQSGHTPPTRSMTREQSYIFGTSGSAWHQWNKHGSCTGFSPRMYYRMTGQALARVTLPPEFERLSMSVNLPASLIEEAFLHHNPNFEADGVTVTCKDGGIAEVRICLDKDLEPRACGADVRRDCTFQKAWFEPLK